MKVDNRIQEAEFEINKDLIIRYKKGFGYWLLKKKVDGWHLYTNSFELNPLGVGFKENYGFGYKDLKPFFFKSFAEAMNNVDKVEEFDYWEYNRKTHAKVFDSIFRVEHFTEILKNKINYENRRTNLAKN